MDIPGWGSDAALERSRTFEYIRIMIHLHKLVGSIPDKVVASALVQETCMTVQRMRALEAVGHGCNPLLLNPFPGYNLQALPSSKPRPAEDTSSSSSAPEAPSFVSSIQASISRAETIRKSKSSWLFKVLPGLQNKEQENAEDIDPELAAQQYKTAEELLKLQQAHEQPFSLKNFAYNVKLFRYEIEPLMLFIALVKRVRDWENPIVTLMTVMMLLNMSYRDYLMYLPALLILINIVIVAVLRYYPNAIWVALGGPQAEAAGGGPPQIEKGGADGAMRAEAKEEVEASTDFAATSASAASSSSSAKSSIPTAQPVAHSVGGHATKKDKDEPEGLLAKLKNYRDVAVKTKDYLHSVQNNIAEQNVKFMKVEGLYKWRSPLVTQKFFAMLCGGFLVMVFIPFRFIFPVLGQATRNSGSERRIHARRAAASMLIRFSSSCVSARSLAL
jgi:hypothetical protein